MEDNSINTPEERRQIFVEEEHVRIYGLDYKERLEKAKFKVRVDDFVKRMLYRFLKKYGLKKDEKIYYCTK